MSISDISLVLYSYDCIHEKQVEFFYNGDKIHKLILIKYNIHQK